MSLHRMLGTGLPNVYLDGGVTTVGSGDEQTIAYGDLDGLYFAIARAISLSCALMTKEELRFLRKRLNLTQHEVGAIGGKSGQAVAKWEKGQLPVPVAEANLLRLMWIAANSRRELVATLKHLVRADDELPPYRYVFRFDGSRWAQDEMQAIALSMSQSWTVAQDAIQRAIVGVAAPSQYTSGATGSYPAAQRAILTGA